VDRILSEIDSVLDEIELAYIDIPFGNSNFQDRMTIQARELTPGRAYRHIGLRMLRRIRDIKHLKYQRQLQNIDIEEKKAIIDTSKTSIFEVRRKQIEIEIIMDGRAWEDKLLKDAIEELNFLYSEFKKYPRYTKEMFEAEEHDHFSIKFANPTDIQILNSIDDFERIVLEMSSTGLIENKE
jgi:hypothetical protein